MGGRHYISVRCLLPRCSLLVPRASPLQLSTVHNSTKTEGGRETPPNSQGWASKLLVGQQSHSSLLSASDYVYAFMTHNYRPGRQTEYLKAFGEYHKQAVKALPSVELVGSWTSEYGRAQDQAIHLWRYKQGYKDIDESMRAHAEDAALRAADNGTAELCGIRKTLTVKSFAYWGEPVARTPTHIYDLRSYVLKPGSMIEWGNAWEKGIAYRREAKQDVGGFFAQVGQLYVVYHIWAYPSMMERHETRTNTWAKPGWDATVASTVPLIEKMQSKILRPTEYSQLQ